MNPLAEFERAVRTLKELFSTIRLDLRAQGYDLKRSPRAFELGLIYCAAMHNHHSAAFDGKEVSSGVGFAETTA